MCVELKEPSNSMHTSSTQYLVTYSLPLNHFLYNFTSFSNQSSTQENRLSPVFELVFLNETGKETDLILYL